MAIEKTTGERLQAVTEWLTDQIQVASRNNQIELSQRMQRTLVKYNAMSGRTKSALSEGFIA